MELIGSLSDWGILFFTALLIGMSKSGIQGITLLAVPLMAMTFGAKPSTGIILPILCFADLMAVLYYRRIAEWRYVLKLLPTAI
ncbi:MAG: sulfite exporter TauE/SafE family protein, partial [Prevotella sp.]|nr:sulfite exporter TauE/SafE family protein [Prevotella sp.]